MERIRVLSEPVDMSIAGDTAFDANVLGFEDDWVMASRKENFLGGCAIDGEGEGGCCVIEANRRTGGRSRIF
jgi:hypothetical protein